MEGGGGGQRGTIMIKFLLACQNMLSGILGACMHASLMPILE